MEPTANLLIDGDLSVDPDGARPILLSVTALDVTGASANILLWYTINGNAPLTAVSVIASPASPQLVNTPITFTASATGGTNVQYQFWMYNQAATPAWSQLQAYSSTATCQWTPTAAGSICSPLPLWMPPARRRMSCSGILSIAAPH